MKAPSCGWFAEQRAGLSQPGSHLFHVPPARAVFSLPLVMMLGVRATRISYAFHGGLLFPIRLCSDGGKGDRKSSLVMEVEGKQCTAPSLSLAGSAHCTGEWQGCSAPEAARAASHPWRVAFLLSQAGRRGSISPLKRC